MKLGYFWMEKYVRVGTASYDWDLSNYDVPMRDLSGE